MGIFDFFKPKSKAGNNKKPERPPIEPDTKQEFSLKFTDFDAKTHSAKVISVKLSPDFYELFPEAKEPKKTGNKLEIRALIVDIVFWGRQVEVTFNPDTVSGSIEEFIKKINNQLNWLIKNKDVVNEVIIRDLLPLKNDSWLGEDEIPLSKEGFLTTISPISIDFDEKTGINLRYNDGGIFLGHGIVVEVSSKQKVKEASIEG